MFLKTKTAGLIFFFFLCICSSAFSLNYYWVNGSGVWSDLSHWNTMPDGTGPIHLNIPTSMDDVYFMNNGGVGYTVTMDAANTIVKCRNMDWSSAPSGCTLTGTGTRADIHGSVVLKAGMTFDFAGDIWFVIDMNVTNTITSDGVHFPNSVIFSGNTGTWNIMNDFYVEKEVAHISGTINTNNHKITVGNNFNYNYYPNYIAMLNMGSSEFNVLQGQAYFGYIPENLNAGTSTVKHHSGGSVLGNTQYLNLPTLYKVKFNTASNSNPSILSALNVQDSLVFNYYGTLRSWSSFNALATIKTAIFNDNGDILNDNNFLHLKLTAGKTYTFGDYTPINGVSNNSTDQTILAGGTFIANGGAGCAGAITVITNASGTPVNIINNSGFTINTYNVLQQDIHGSGSMPMINNNGHDLGNCTGWTFNTPQPPFDLYWIGGAGEWIDPNHWSLTNGGASSGCIPNAITNVHFTNMSGFTATSGDVEEITTPVDYRNLTCRDLDFSGVIGYPTFKSVFNGTNTSILNIYGSSRFGVEMKQAFKSKIYFKGNGNHDIESNGIPFKSSLIFDGMGNWSLQDSFTMDTVVYPYPIFTKVNHISGTIRTMGHSLLLRGNPGWFGNLLEGQPNEWFCCKADRGAELWLGEPNGASSNIYIRNQNFWMEYQPGKFHAEKSHIIGELGNNSVSARNQPHDFYNVTFNIESSDSKFNGGIIGKLINNNREIIVQSNVPHNRNIHYAEFKQLGIINDNQVFDTLIFTGGFRYVLEKNKTQTITANGALISMGGCDSLVYIQSSDGAAAATIKKETGSNLVIDNTIVENIIADLSTGVTYTINNGLTLANSAGWTVVNPTARDLYWVGNGGFWDDGTHWATSSGGTGGNCPPTPLDNVFFDQHSFASANQTVQIRQYDAYSKDINWTGVQFNPRFFASTYLIHFNIFGDYILDQNMTHDFYGEANFRADHPTSVTMAGHQFNFDVHFKNPLGDWTFTDNFKNQSIYGGQADIYQVGTIRTIGNVQLYGSWRALDLSKLFFNNSTISLFSNGISYPSRSIFNTLPENFHSGTSHFTIENGFGNTVYIAGKYVLDFYDVTSKSTNSFIENVGIKNKLLFEKLGAIYTNVTPSDTIFINEVEFKEGGLQRSGLGQLAYHKLTYAPGQNYEFSGKHFVVPRNGQEGELNIAGLPNQYIQLRMWTQSGLPAEIVMDDINNSPTCTQYVFLSNMAHTGTEIIQVPTPGGNVINNSGWAFIPCNPCPNNPPILDTTLSDTVRCGSGTVDLVLMDLLPGENAVWFRDSLLTDTIYNSSNLFQPVVSTDTCFWAKVFNEGGQCYSSDTIRVCIHVNINPTTFAVTGGGAICTGANLNILLADSEVGVSYQLQLDGVDYGSPQTGTGSQLIFTVIFPIGVTSGTFTIIATGEGGCTNTMSNNVIGSYLPSPAPSIGVTSNNPVCSLGGSIALFESGGEAVSWAWSGPGGWTSSVQNPVRTPITPGETGWYECTITALNGCTNVSYIYVEVLSSPIMNQPVSSAYCHNTATDEIVFTSSDPDVVYNWVNNNTSIGLDEFGCGNIPSFTALNNTNAPATATITVTPLTQVEIGNFAYVPNRSSNNVSVINLQNNSLVTTIPVGVEPYGVAASPDGKRVYITNSLSNSVSVIKTSTNTVLTTINVGFSVYGVTVSPDGTKVYVSNFHNNSITVINACTNLIEGFIGVGQGPFGVLLSPDGSKIYTANYLSDNVTVIDAITNTVITTVGIQDGPVGLALNADGSRLYVSNFFSNTLSVINTLSNTVITNIGVGTLPVGVAVSLDNNYVYVANLSDNNVSVIDAVSNSVISNVNVGSGPYGVSLNDDGSLLYVANRFSNDLSVLSTATNTVIGSLAVGSNPNALGNFITMVKGCEGEPKSFTITVNPIPDVVLPSSISLCSEDNVGSIVFSGNVANTIFTWTNDNTDIGLGSNGTGDLPPFIATNSTTTAISGKITVYPQYTNTGVTCSGVPDDFTITVNPAPMVNPITDVVLCSNQVLQAINFTGNLSGIAYNWTNDNTIFGLASSGTGGIPITFLNAIGGSPAVANITVIPSLINGGQTCMGVPETFQIIVNPLPIMGYYPDIVTCAGQNAGAIPFTSNVPGAMYTWTNNNPSIGLGANGTGDISVFVATNNTLIAKTALIRVFPSFTNAGLTCAPEQTVFFITVNPLPAPTIMISETSSVANNDGTICSGSNATLTANGGGTYLWSTGATTSSITTGNAGTYTVTVTSAGCAGTASRTITVNPLPAPVIMISETSGVDNNDGIICSGSNATLTANGGGIYVWSTGATTSSITTGNAGTYTVTVTSAGCAGTASQTITVNPLPAPVIIISETSGVANNDGTICSGSNAMLLASGAGTYLWSTGATSSSITTGTPGAYTVTVTSAGCSATAMQMIIVNPQPVSEIVIRDGSGVISTDGSICSGLPATLTASGGTSYLWSNQSTTSSITTMIPGTYTVTVTSLGCTTISSATVSFNAFPCGWAECNAGSACDASWTYDLASGVYTGTASHCYYANPFNHDELALLATSLCGNSSITVLVTSITGSLAWAGITMRESNAPDSKKVQLMTNLSLLDRREARYMTGGTSYPQQFPSQNRYWLRLVRINGQFVGYVSPNGTQWYEVMAVTLSMNTCVKVGMVVTNYNNNSTATATFSNVVVTGANNYKPVVNDHLQLLHEKSLNIDFGITPNPSTGIVELQLQDYINKKVQIEIYSPEGKLVGNRSFHEVNVNESIDLSEYTNGLYLVRLKAEGYPDVTKRVVVLK